MESHAKCEIYYIRHALSFFNLFVELQKCKESGSSTTGADASEIEELAKVKDKFDPKLADPRLTIKGIKQCEDAKAIYHKLPIRCVFVSPLRRALETCELLFQDHPLKKDIQFIVHPLLTEMLAGSNEIPVPIQEKIEEYGKKKYDFSLFSGYDRPELYFVYNLNSPENEQLLKAVKEAEPSISYLETIGNAARERRKTHPTHDRKLENYVNLRKRARLLALYAMDYMRSHGLKSGEVAVVAHDTIIGQTVSSDFNSYHKGIFKSLENCSYRLFDVNTLTKLKF